MEFSHEWFNTFLHLYVQCHNSNFRPPSRARPMHGGCLCFSVYRKPKVSFCRDRPTGVSMKSGENWKPLLFFVHTVKVIIFQRQTTSRELSIVLKCLNSCDSLQSVGHAFLSAPNSLVPFFNLSHEYSWSYRSKSQWIDVPVCIESKFKALYGDC